MPFSDTSLRHCSSIPKRSQDGSHNHFSKKPGIFKSKTAIFLENCSVFGTTIFLDRRKYASIGENGFRTYSKNYSVIFSALFEIFKH